MKRLLPILSFALIMTACNQSAKFDDQAAIVAQPAIAQPDTAGLAAYQSWKAMNELSDDEAYNNSQKSVASAPVKRSAAKAAPVKRVVTKAPVRKASTSTSTAKSSGSSSEGVN